MSLIKRFSLHDGKMHQDPHGPYCLTGDAAERDKRIMGERDATLSQLAALREELARKDKAIEDMIESNSDMVQCLQSAEQSKHEAHCVLLDPEEPAAECTCARKIEQRLADAERLNAELIKAVSDAEYRADQGKVWNGMGWTYTGLHSHGQQKVLDILRAALNKPEEAKS